MSDLVFPRRNVIKPVNPKLNPTHPLSRGLVLAYLFDNPPETGRVVDYSNFQTDLDQFNSLTQTNWAASPHGGAIDFTNSTSVFLQSTTYADVLNNMPLLAKGGGLSISGWIYQRTNGSGGFGVLLRKNATGGPTSGWQFGASASATSMQLQAQFSTANVDLRWAVPQNQWFHVVFTWQGTVAGRTDVYVNGVLATLTTATGGTGNYTTDAAQSIIMGKSGSAEPYDGLCESIMVWNRKLSPGEAKSLYQDAWNMFRPTIAQKAYLYNVIPSTTPVGTVTAAPMRAMMGMGT